MKTFLVIIIMILGVTFCFILGASFELKNHREALAKYCKQKNEQYVIINYKSYCLNKNKKITRIEWSN